MAMIVAGVAAVLEIIDNTMVATDGQVILANLPIVLGAQLSTTIHIQRRLTFPL